MATQYVTLEIEATLTADMQQNDFGVDRSPVWYEAENIELDVLYINGVEYDREKLVAEFGKQGADRLEEILADASDGDDWEE